MAKARKERRRHLRIEKDITLEVDTGNGVHFTTRSVNISRGGVFFRVHRLIAATATGKIILHLPKEEKVCCRIELVRTEPASEIHEHYWAGRFHGLDKKGERKIAGFIDDSVKEHARGKRKPQK